MATDVEVQYFSHLNGLVLGNNWGDLIRMLDKALVTGIDFTSITAASIDAQGDVHITLYAAHKAMLFQVVELSGFTPNSLNQKYRIKGVPNTTQLILKPKDTIAGTTITVVGNGKLVPLGYDIIFRDVNDVKRVYRAKNPTAQHPFIRVDESIASDTGSYSSTYVKSAMVGLLEHMDHIDDYQNPNVLQLPIDTTDIAKNWKITTKGPELWNVVRGWSKWYYATSGSSYPTGTMTEFVPPGGLGRYFTIFGDRDAFYLSRCLGENGAHKMLSGCGLYNSCLPSSVAPDWFLITTPWSDVAGVNKSWTSINNGTPLAWSKDLGAFFTTKRDDLGVSSSVNAFAITPDFETGYSGIYSAANLSALEIPFYDADKYLRGTLKHVHYSGKNHQQNTGVTTPMLYESSMYLWETQYIGNSRVGGVVVYLGELE